MKNKAHLTHYIFLITCLLLVSIQQIHAQDNKIFELKSESGIHGSTTSKNTNDNDGNDDDDDNIIPYQLLYSLKPTIYIKNNSIIKVTGPNKPVSLTTSDANSFNILKTENPLFDSVQILKIQLNDLSDLNNYLDVSSINGFNNLKHIYIMCYFKCTENQIRAFIKNANPEINIYFEQVNPS
tara:strand:- start:2903 stop:3448 length:546 start_codon:yes stop_codon:yes gene_type:complete